MDDEKLIIDLKAAEPSQADAKTDPSKLTNELKSLESQTKDLSSQNSVN